MQINIYSIVILFVLFSFCTEAGENGQERTDSFKFMSYNIRYNNPDDGVNAWPNRKDNVAEMIGSKHQADIAGLQEVRKEQIDDLEERLPDYEWTGVGRDDGKSGGEFTPIFYRKARFELLDDDTFWLSKSPEEPGSKSWDAARPRIVSWAKFRDRQTDRTFYLFNTHFSPRGKKARRESARLITQRIPAIAGNKPALITGDFNTVEDSDSYRIIENYDQIRDARYFPGVERTGPNATYNDWNELHELGSPVDYIFVYNDIEVLTHRILTDKYNDRFPSDHLPVMVDVLLP